jgi:lysophospholipase L1-like esterase
MPKPANTTSLTIKIFLGISLLVNILLFAKLLNNKYGFYQPNKQSGPHNPDILFIGDSQTQLFDVNKYFKNPHIKNRGIIGDVTAGVLDRLKPLTITQPSKIFIQIGINDLLSIHIGTDSALINYTQIVKTIKKDSPGSKIYLESVLPTKLVSRDTLNKYNAGVKKLSDDNNLTFINLYDSFNENGNLNMNYDCGDGLHLNGKGYLEWKKLLNKYL